MSGYKFTRKADYPRGGSHAVHLENAEGKGNTRHVAHLESAESIPDEIIEGVEEIDIDELWDAPETADKPRERFLDPAVRDGRPIEFDRRTLMLRLPVYKGNWLELDLATRFCTKAATEETIAWLKRKSWFTPELSRDLIDAIEDACDRVFGIDSLEDASARYADEDGFLDWRRKGLPVAQSLGELKRPDGDDPDELLRYRYLCRGGGLLLVGPTGIGKSSFSMQAAIHWAVGREVFSIKPARALRSLVIQAENDDGDLAEMRDGILAGLGFGPEQSKDACNNIKIVREDSRSGGEFFGMVVKPLLAEHRPDLIWIDPALAFLGGESNSQADVGAFLRNGLNPCLNEFGCGCVVVHHTNKPPSGKERVEWSGSDFAYLGGGSAEWANWARAVLAIRSLGSNAVFELRAGKRGGRLGWKEADGQTKAFYKAIAHATEPGVICWREVAESEMPKPKERKPAPTKEEVLPHIPTDKPIGKDALRSRCNTAGIAINRVNGLIAELIDAGLAYEWSIKRPGTNPQKLIARQPQPPQEELPKQQDSTGTRETRTAN